MRSNTAIDHQEGSYTNVVPKAFKEVKARWYPLRHHPEQARLWVSPYRFNVVPSGRRSGKTEIAGKRKVVAKAIRGSVEYPDYNTFIAAPTRDQVRRIYWKDVKAMVPPSLILGKPSESRLTVETIHGSTIALLGMDKPERAEGLPWNHGVLDEYGNMKPETWEEHILPALADRQGSCDLIGVPEGRGHYYEVAQIAQSDDTGVWGYFHWVSADILSPEEIDLQRRNMDPLTFQQEMEGAFVSFRGMAYHQWDEDFHVGNYLKHYNPKRPLVLMLDFNIDPGVATIGQEMRLTIPGQPYIIGQTTTAIIGEVWIERASNTMRIIRRFLKEWGDHKGELYVYGDATGGAQGSAKVEGSDWDIVKKMLEPKFGGRVYYRVPKANPRERARVNAVNSRLRNTYDEVYMVVDHTCKHTINDFGGVRVKDDGSGQVDKKRDPMLSHLSDAVGYYVNKEWPVLRWKPSGERYWK